MEEAVFFRPSKKRKHNSIRHVLPEGESESALTPTTNEYSDGSSSEAEPTTDKSNLASLLRARKQNKSRGSGVVFSNVRQTFSAVEGDQVFDEVGKDDTETAATLQNISNRFIGSSGHVVNVDKHMTAYIDSELGKISGLQTSHRKIDDSPAGVTHENGSTIPDHPLSSTMSRAQTSKSTAQTGLHEVDLGTSTYDMNLARTQAALARVQAGHFSAIEEEPKPPRRRRIRIGRDGKPMKARPPRKRRDSEELARDALVEQVLHQHKLDKYDSKPSNSVSIKNPSSEHPIQLQPKSPTHQPQSSTPTNNTTTKTNPTQPTAPTEIDHDELLANRFRQDFMDAIADRHSHRPKPTTSQTKRDGPSNAGNSVDQLLRGPKLGGGRSARAKMVQQLTAAATAALSSSSISTSTSTSTSKAMGQDGKGKK